MTPRPDQASAKWLRFARPRLNCRAEREEGRRQVIKLTPYISEVQRGWDEVVEEGYDVDYGPLAPVYWRVVNRGDEQLYCSTFLLTRDVIIRGWGTKALANCDPTTGKAAAQIETLTDPASDLLEKLKFGAEAETALEILLFGEPQLHKIMAETHKRVSS